MSIEKNKLNKIISEVIKENLLLGYVPTSDEVILQISDAINKQNVEDPFFEYIKEDFNITKLNNSKDIIIKDVNLLLESVFDIYQLAKLQAQKIDTEREKQNKRLDELETILERLSLKYSVAGYLSGYINPITTVSSFNTEETTAFVDTINREIRLKANDNILMDDFNVKLMNSNIQSNGDIDTFIRAPGLLWNGYYSTIDKNQKSEITLIITLNQAINLFKANMPMLKACNISIYQAKVADSYEHVYTGKVNGNITCQINPLATLIKIVLTKTEADKFDAATNRYYFYYLIDTIELFKTKYLFTSYFQTKEITIPEEANTFMLIAEEEIPSGCNISYRISTNAIDWFDVDNKGIINRNIIDYNLYQNITNSEDRSASSFIDQDLSIVGNTLYRLGFIENTSVINPRLYKGANCWKESVLLLTAPITGIIDEGYFTAARAAGTSIIYNSYNEINPSQSAYVYNNYSAPSIRAIENSITIEKNAASAEKRSIIHSYPITVYLNGDIIYQSLASTTPKEIRWAFRKGKNFIKIYTNISEANVFVPTTQNILTIYLGMDFLKSSQNCYAEETACREMTITNLQYNSLGIQNSYALVPEGTGYEIISNSSDIYVPYKLVYNSLNSTTNSLYVSGTLFSPNSSVTPKIKLLEVRYSKS